MTTTHSVTHISDRELLFKRTLNAPRELVFKVWTEEAHILKWWGPTGFTNTIHRMEVKPGGVWEFMMHGPDGTDYPNRIVFKEVIKPEKLSYSHGSDDKDHPGDFESVVTFEENGDKTDLTMRVIFRSKEELNKVVEQYGAVEGNKQTMDKLEAYLATL